MESPTDQSKSSPIDEKIGKIKIVLDHPDNTYYSGQTIFGTIYLNYSEIRGIHFRVIGKSKCGWTEWLVRESKPADGKTETSDSRYWGKEEHLNPAVYIVGAKNGALFTPEKSYRFSFELKSDLPSTFKTDYGEINYKMKFYVDKRWFTDKQKIDLKIIKTVNLNQILETLKPYENQLTKTYGLVDSGPISLHVSMPKRGFVLGEKIPITVTVSNASKLQVEKLKYFLYQYVEYHSTSPSERIRTEDKRLLKKEADGISKKSEEKFELVIDVPDNIPPNQDKTSSRLIHIRYELRIEAKIGSLYKSLVITAPITIGTIPHEQSVTFRVGIPQTPQTPDGRLTHVFSNLSLDFSPHNHSNRSSIQTPQYPISPIGFQCPVSSVSPISMMSSASIGSQMNNRYSFSPPNAQYPMNPYLPTAPPIMSYDCNSSAPARPTSLFVPPTYDEACGNSQGHFNQLNYSAPPTLTNIPHKS